MAPTRRAVLGMAAVTVGLSGCTGGGNGGGDGGDGGDGGTTNGGSPGDGSSGATVAVDSHDEFGEILVDADGAVLYMFDPDEQGSGASTCYDDCEDAWPPLTVDGEPAASDSVGAELTTFEREDGSTQVAADGWPLYYFAGDESPGDATGQGVNDVWWVIRPDGTPVRPDSDTAAAVQVRSHPDLGDVLVDSEGMTLYMFDSDERGADASTCSGDCADAWPPLTVDGEPEAGDDVTAGLTTFERDGGETQVAANGWPLYYFASDSEPDDVAGQGVNDVWWVLDPSGSPVRGNREETDDGGGSDGGGGGGSDGGVY